ncbi:MAG: VanZ family protein [Erysipelotrichales bacterium]
MNKEYRPYIVIALITLIYLLFFSSRILVLTNLSPLTFNLISSVLVFFYLDIIYKLFIKQYQLNKVETILFIGSYFIILLYLLFFKSTGNVKSSTLDLVPYFFTYPKPSQFMLMIGNTLAFLPLGYFYHRYNLKFSLLAILLLGFGIEGIQYVLHVGVFDLSDILLYVIGFYIGWFYYNFVKVRSSQFDNLSYDLSLISVSVVVLIIISTLSYIIFF